MFIAKMTPMALLQDRLKQYRTISTFWDWARLVAEDVHIFNRFS